MPRDTKSKSSQNAATPAQTLAKLNGYMEAAGYAVDHPWRLEIASTLNSPATIAAEDSTKTDSAVDRARDAVTVAGIGASFLNDNIHPAVDALVELSKFDSMDLAENRARMGRIKDLAKLCRYLVEDAAGCMEGELHEMQGKLDLLEGGAA